MLKTILRSLLKAKGYRIIPDSRLAPRDLRDDAEDPRVAKYLARKSSFLINGDLRKCRTFWRFSCDHNGDNPYIEDLKRYIETGVLEYSDSALREFYDRFRPDNAAQMFELTGDLNEKLLELPAYGTVLPWENASMEGKIKFRTTHVKRETRARGEQLSIRHGISWHGPISEKRGKQEIEYLKELCSSIEESGYDRGSKDHRDIGAAVLVRDDSFRFLITDGYHRTAVLSALGFEAAPLRVDSGSVPAFIHEDEVEFWPKVRSGLYTAEQALKIFGVVFEGRGV